MPSVNSDEWKPATLVGLNELAAVPGTVEEAALASKMS
jgi:hypothetical protein